MPSPFGLPRLPGLPPLPKLAREEANPIPESTPAQNNASTTPNRDADQLGIVMKRRGPDPTAWLKPHQQRLAEASRVASERTMHLTGVKRVVERQRIIRELLTSPKENP